jgi:hypothetical protein
MPNFIDEPSKDEFISAIIKTIPKQATKHDVAVAGAVYLAARAVKRELKNR